VIGAKSFSHELTTNKTFMVHQSTHMHPQQFWEKIMNYCFNFKPTSMQVLLIWSSNKFVEKWTQLWSM